MLNEDEKKYIHYCYEEAFKRLVHVYIDATLTGDNPDATKRFKAGVVATRAARDRLLSC